MVGTARSLRVYEARCLKSVISAAGRSGGSARSVRQISVITWEAIFFDRFFVSSGRFVSRNIERRRPITWRVQRGDNLCEG